LERGLQLAREGGLSALLTMRNWMFIKQFSALREWLLATYDLRLLGDVDRGAFEEVPDEVVSAVMSLFRKSAVSDAPSIAMQPTSLDDKSRDGERTQRKRAAVLCQVGRFEFDSSSFSKLGSSAYVYWWSSSDIDSYVAAPKLGDVASVRKGMITSNDRRFLRMPWEPDFERVLVVRSPHVLHPALRSGWVPLVKGAAGRTWLENIDTLIEWRRNGLGVKLLNQHLYGSYTRQIMNEDFYFHPAVAFVTIGNTFGARAHRYSSVIASKGSSVYTSDVAGAVIAMNTTRARRVLQDLNPSIDFQTSDVSSLPLVSDPQASQIFATLEDAFESRERSCETSADFIRPGPHCWRYAQGWAQRAVDRSVDSQLPSYEPEWEPESLTERLSYAFGVAIGRFGARGEGILAAAPPEALKEGMLYISAVGDGDSLSAPAAGEIRTFFDAHKADVDPKRTLKEYLAERFFPDVHRKMYENRPIYFPLSSKNKSFVAYVSIHRWTIDTLRALLAEHLYPEKQRLEGEKDDLRQARQSADKKAVREAEKRFTQVDKWLDELDAFVKLVEQCAEKGPPPTDGKCKPRDRDARYEMELDDGVMINAAALWPLLEPQWKDPAKWWKELANAEGKKDYDWSHLAARYFPDRVDGKCRVDPSLAVAHGCFWKYHPAKAYQWELRLQDEIGPDFKLDEPARDAEQAYTPAWVQLSSDAYRAEFEAAHPDKVEALVAAEQKRREKKRKKGAESEDEEQGELELDESGEDDA
jgi:hypothetical protein